MKRMMILFPLVLALIIASTTWVSADEPQRAILGRGTPGVIAKFVDSYHVGDSGIIDTGFIGIGTTSPGAMLHVSQGFSGGGPILIIENTDATGDIAIDFLSGSGELGGLVGNLGVINSGEPKRFFVLQNNPKGMPLTLAEEGGNVGVGTINPQSALQVVGYTQLDLTSGPPPGEDCDDATERGRMKVDSGAGVLYICVDGGWLGK